MRTSSRRTSSSAFAWGRNQDRHFERLLVVAVLATAMPARSFGRPGRKGGGRSRRCRILRFLRVAQQRHDDAKQAEKDRDADTDEPASILKRIGAGSSFFLLGAHLDRHESAATPGASSGTWLGAIYNSG